MSIFANIKTEDIIQVNDKTRLKASGSFISKDEAAVTLVEIQPEATESFIPVTDADSDNWFLDWAYQGVTRVVTVSVRLTTDGVPVTTSKTMSVVTEADDGLWSTDEMLTAKESEILNFVPVGRNSFINVHREAQKQILNWFDENGYTDQDGNKFTKASFVDVSEVRDWSQALTLSLIYADISDKLDDVFMSKSKTYKSEAKGHTNRSIIRVDLDGDATIDLGEAVRVQTIGMVRV